MELFRSFLRNTRKPEGFLGKCMVASMNYAHAALADWGLGCLPKTGPVRIAELGCGGGRNIRALLRKYPAATVTALDYSEISVEKARNINQEELQAGRCRVIQGDVSRLPFEDRAFDLRFTASSKVSVLRLERIGSCPSLYSCHHFLMISP